MKHGQSNYLPRLRIVLLLFFRLCFLRIVELVSFATSYIYDHIFVNDIQT